VVEAGAAAGAAAGSEAERPLPKEPRRAHTPTKKVRAVSHALCCAVHPTAGFVWRSLREVRAQNVVLMPEGARGKGVDGCAGRRETFTSSSLQETCCARQDECLRLRRAAWCCM
jgi:hypothetical protein